jgi:nucleotide-binding universal stress UspA family protein
LENVKTILVPIDFSPVTRAVMAEAVSLAKSAGARLVLLHIAQPTPLVADYGPPMAGFVMPVMEAQEENATRQLGRWRHRVDAQELPVMTVRLAGAAPSQLIVEEAERRSADYIVMGSHGHTALYDLLVGSTTGGVLKKAPCPVIVIPARHSAPAQSVQAAQHIPRNA